VILRGSCQHACFGVRSVEIEPGEQASLRDAMFWLIVHRRPQRFLAFAPLVPLSPKPDKPEPCHRHHDSRDPVRNVPFQLL
jgi:hypothetical protein